MILILRRGSVAREQLGCVCAAVERKIATKTRGVPCARLLRGRALSATRAGVYLNLKLGDRSWEPNPPPLPSISPPSLSPFLSFSLSYPAALARLLALLPDRPHRRWLSRTSNSRLLSIVSAPGTSLEKLINVSRWPIYPPLSLFPSSFNHSPVGTLCARAMRRGAQAWETRRRDATRRRVF